MHAAACDFCFSFTLSRRRCSTPPPIATIVILLHCRDKTGPIRQQRRSPTASFLLPPSLHLSVHARFWTTVTSRESGGTDRDVEETAVHARHTSNETTLTHAHSSHDTRRLPVRLSSHTIIFLSGVKSWLSAPALKTVDLALWWTIEGFLRRFLLIELCQHQLPVVLSSSTR